MDFIVSEHCGVSWWITTLHFLDILIYFFITAYTYLPYFPIQDW
jgi:hypothetical protein